MMTAEIVLLGKIVKTVGLKGEVKLLPGPDFWPGTLGVDGLGLVSPKGVRRQVRIDRKRPKGNTFVIKLSGVDTIDEAEHCVGSTLEVSMDQIDEASAPDRLLPFQVIGAEVRLPDGEVVGTVTDMLLGPGQDCLIVERDAEQLIIPNVPEVVVNVDIEKKIIEIDPPEGLLDLRW
ncbi:MAG: ribosome maturation factor RimM [Bacteroidales bacterium]|nr:ribosome maturation factor RimM [Candidatus Latescibacterota bacterium]